jgi:ABC-2 type transport system ATP-binding protein
VTEIMDVCDLRNKAAKRLIGNLSKGFRQRVGIADALLGQPEVVIMDEPTIGLDPHQIRAVRKLIDRMRGNMTVILSSHILHEIDAVCDRSMIINRGRIVASGTLAQMRKRYELGVCYHLQVKGDFKQLDELLASIDPSLKRLKTESADEDGYHEVVVDAGGSSDFGAEIIRLVAGCDGVKVRQCTRRESDLEDVFLAATKRSWDVSLEKETSEEGYSSLSGS